VARPSLHNRGFDAKNHFNRRKTPGVREEGRVELAPRHADQTGAIRNIE
jgi:hypothetical protein